MNNKLTIWSDETYGNIFIDHTSFRGLSGSLYKQYDGKSKKIDINFKTYDFGKFSGILLLSNNFKEELTKLGNFLLLNKETKAPIILNRSASLNQKYFNNLEIPIDKDSSISPDKLIQFSIQEIKITTALNILACTSNSTTNNHGCSYYLYKLNNNSIINSYSPEQTFVSSAEPFFYENKKQLLICFQSIDKIFLCCADNQFKQIAFFNTIDDIDENKYPGLKKKFLEKENTTTAKITSAGTTTKTSPTENTDSQITKETKTSSINQKTTSSSTPDTTKTQKQKITTSDNKSKPTTRPSTGTSDKRTKTVKPTTPYTTMQTTNTYIPQFDNSTNNTSAINQRGNNAGLAMGIVFPVIVVILVVALILAALRNKKYKGYTLCSNEKSSKDVETERKIHQFNLKFFAGIIYRTFIKEQSTLMNGKREIIMDFAKAFLENFQSEINADPLIAELLLKLKPELKDETNSSICEKILNKNLRKSQNQIFDFREIEKIFKKYPINTKNKVPLIARKNTSGSCASNDEIDTDKLPSNTIKMTQPKQSNKVPIYEPCILIETTLNEKPLCKWRCFSDFLTEKEENELEKLCKKINKQNNHTGWSIC
jgi:hypothetical protein